jgi:hypothetical protein
MSPEELDAYLDFGPEQLDLFAEAELRESFRRWRLRVRHPECSCAGVWWVKDCECQTEVRHVA